jgi:hypothetical protein
MDSFIQQSLYNLDCDRVFNDHNSDSAFEVDIDYADDERCCRVTYDDDDDCACEERYPSDQDYQDYQDHMEQLAHESYLETIDAEEKYMDCQEEEPEEPEEYRCFPMECDYKVGNSDQFTTGTDEENIEFDTIVFQQQMAEIEGKYESEHPMFPLLLRRYIKRGIDAAVELKRATSVQHSQAAIKFAESSLKHPSSPYAQQICTTCDHNTNVKTSVFIIRHPDGNYEERIVYSKILKDYGYGIDITKPLPPVMKFVEEEDEDTKMLQMCYFHENSMLANCMKIDAIVPLQHPFLLTRFQNDEPSGDDKDTMDTSK